jgi:hypothetical protein
VAIRDREARRDAAEQDAVAAANASAQAAYEAQWRNTTGQRPAAAFDVYADGGDPLGRHSLEVVEAEPPPNELVIAEPKFEITELAVVPRPFRDDDARQ